MTLLHRFFCLRKIPLLFCLAAQAGFALDQGEKVIPVACVGDSITYGVGTDNPKLESYPARLQTLLGKKWAVRNYGVSGRTMLIKGHPLNPDRAMRFNPDIVIIALGTNDSKTHIWSKHQDQFVTDYVAMIRSFQALPSRPRILACLPPPTFPGDWGITQAVIRDKVIPAIREAARQTGIELIDLNTPLLACDGLFPDTVHPNRQGALRIAELVAVAIRTQQ